MQQIPTGAGRFAFEAEKRLRKTKDFPFQLQLVAQYLLERSLFPAHYHFEMGLAGQWRGSRPAVFNNSIFFCKFSIGTRLTNRGQEKQPVRQRRKSPKSFERELAGWRMGILLPSQLVFLGG